MSWLFIILACVVAPVLLALLRHWRESKKATALKNETLSKIEQHLAQIEENTKPQNTPALTQIPLIFSAFLPLTDNEILAAKLAKSDIAEFRTMSVEEYKKKYGCLDPDDMYDGPPPTSAQQKIIDAHMKDMLERHPEFGFWDQHPEYVEKFTKDINLGELGIDKDGNVS